MLWPPPGSTRTYTLVPYTTLFRSLARQGSRACAVLRFASVASDAPSVASGPSIAIEAAWCGLEHEKRRFSHGDHRHLQEDRLERVHRRHRDRKSTRLNSSH